MTLPLITPVLTIIVLFSVIQTFADFQLIWVLTGGGPTNSTHVFATYAYQIGMLSGELSNGAAISLFMFPFMLIFTVLVLWYQRRDIAMSATAEQVNRSTVGVGGNRLGGCSCSGCRWCCSSW